MHRDPSARDLSALAFPPGFCSSPAFGWRCRAAECRMAPPSVNR
jgi:hypothetical protein